MEPLESHSVTFSLQLRKKKFVYLTVERHTYTYQELEVPIVTKVSVIQESKKQTERS